MQRYNIFFKPANSLVDRVGLRMEDDAGGGRAPLACGFALAGPYK